MYPAQTHHIGAPLTNAAIPPVSQSGPSADRPTPRRLQDHEYLHTTHPDTGEAVVFLPGETLPDWACPRTDSDDLERPSEPKPVTTRGTRPRGRPHTNKLEAKADTGETTGGRDVETLD